MFVSFLLKAMEKTPDWYTEMKKFICEMRTNYVVSSNKGFKYIGISPLFRRDRFASETRRLV